MRRQSAAVEDQTRAIFGDLSWVVRHMYVNLGTLAIATHLRDLGFGKVDAYYPQMRSVFVESPYDFIGLSTNEVTLTLCLERLAALRRKFGDQPLILVGGPGMEHWWEFLLKGGADGVVTGDGQYPLTELFELLGPRVEAGATLAGAWRDALAAGELSAVKDLSFVDSAGRLQRNPMQSMVRDLDEYPRVDYSLIRGGVKLPTKCVHYSTGCVFKCDFCSSIVNQRHSYRTVSVERALEEMEAAHKEGFKSMQLASDLVLPGNAKQNRRFIERLAEFRKARGITIRVGGETTVSSLHDIIFRNTGTEDEPRFEENPEGLQLLRDAGLVMWALGVEALAEEERARLGKDPRQAGADATRTMTTLCRHGFSVHAMMMVHEDTSYDRAVEIGRILGRIGVESVQFFYPVPAPQTPWGTKMFERDDFLIGTVGGQRQGGSRATGEYLVAARNPTNAFAAVETCYDSFTSLRGVLHDLVRGELLHAGVKVGLRFLMLARRYLVPQYYEYHAAILTGDYRRYTPGDEKWPGMPLYTLGSPRLSFRMWPLLKRAREQLRAQVSMPLPLTKGGGASEESPLSIRTPASQSDVQPASAP